MGSRSGFTLLELILAMLILSLIGTYTWAAVRGTFKTQKAVYERTFLQETGTAILHKIREDLSQSFHVETPRPLTLFKGEDNLNHDRVVFTSLCRSRTAANVKESDQTEVRYETAANPADPQLFLLKRRETAFIDGVDDEQGEFITVADNVAVFNLEYSKDGEKYENEWDIRSQDHLNQLPKLVRLSLTLRDEKGKEDTFSTTINIPMADPLGIKTNPTSTLTPSPSPGTGSGSGTGGSES